MWLLTVGWLANKEVFAEVDEFRDGGDELGSVDAGVSEIGPTPGDVEISCSGVVAG